MIKATLTVESIWKADLKTHKNSTSYNEYRTVCIQGPISIAKLSTAAEKVLARHSAFSIKYMYEDDGLWIENSYPISAKDICVIKATSEKQAQYLLEEFIYKAFDIQLSPLYRFTIIHCEENEKVFVNLTAHHTIVDGWSFSIFF
ncbi:condensation domain-containing protein [Xenorhabdus cabanillasii]|uniref:Condensation domain-containing protein n=1 Tax=Xenorhabdus cabanillasii TaxID=351673 RepID=A0A3D9UK97_9GAMM|nr:condensation domain-containing protein [Xenorhabdus cabanillasii]REF26404.1 condensation domain-containing protein [Xenorhabdus cabanillasii]